MLRTSQTCERCARANFSKAIMRSTPGKDFYYEDFFYEIRTISMFLDREEECFRCNQLTKILRMTFSDIETTSLPECFRLGATSISNPALTRYQSTYFCFRSFERGAPWRYLLPVQARFVDNFSNDHFYHSFGKPISPDTIDYNMFNDCIKLCRSRHSTTCNSISQFRFTTKRLIDCKDRVICTAPNSRYICLSYVWGDAPTENATFDDRSLAEIPQTVSDAMFVTLRLGMRYLWVDRYCIDQNNPEEKHDAIRNMDSIYRNAFITIIAAAGSGSDYGLPGVSRPRKSTPPVGIDSHAFMVMQNPSIDMKDSTWNTRGWTYQEMLLSRRRLIFTDYQSYFQCQKHQTMEQLHKDFESTDSMKRMLGYKHLLPTQEEFFTVDEIYSRLEEYYPRTLRYETDNINAFVGVFRELSDRTSDHYSSSPSGLYMPHQNPHFYGIPLWLDLKLADDDNISWRFGLSLGWRIEKVKNGPLFAHAGAMVKPSFPSWSWASTKGQRLNHDHYRIVFSSRPSHSGEIQDANFSAYVTHKSGERISLSAYTTRADDYTLFHPW